MASARAWKERLRSIDPAQPALSYVSGRSGRLCFGNFSVWSSFAAISRTLARVRNHDGGNFSRFGPFTGLLHIRCGRHQCNERPGRFWRTAFDLRSDHHENCVPDLAKSLNVQTACHAVDDSAYRFLILRDLGIFVEQNVSHDVAKRALLHRLLQIEYGPDIDIAQLPCFRGPDRRDELRLRDPVGDLQETVRTFNKQQDWIGRSQILDILYFHLAEPEFDERIHSVDHVEREASAQFL